MAASSSPMISQLKVLSPKKSSSHSVIKKSSAYLIIPYFFTSQDEGNVFDMTSFSTIEEIQQASQKVLKYILDHGEYTFTPLYNEAIFKLFLDYVRRTRRIPFFDWGFVFDIRFVDASTFLSIVRLLKNMDETLLLQILHVIEDNIDAPLSIKIIAETLMDALESKYIPLSLAVTMSPSYAELRDVLPIDTYASGRPRTTMPFAGSIAPLDVELVSENEFIFRATDSQSQEKSPKFSKVIRYATRYGGTYYEPENEITYCGVYYYLEPESNFVLQYQSYLISRNKHVATQQLISRVKISSLSSDDAELFGKIVQHASYFDDPRAPIEHRSRLFDYANIGGDVFRDFMNGEDTIRLNNPNQQLVPRDGYIYESGVRVRFFDELWADEDRLDQPLCLLARMLNIDVVILTHMVGRQRYTSEIMDSRDSKVSYQNLRRIVS